MVLRRNRTHRSEGPDTHQPRVEAQPEAYERWRRTTLGSATQTRELEVVFDLAGPLRNQRLLDVGCGDGIYLVEAARCGAVASGVDISEAMLIVARRRAADAGVTVDLGFADAQALPFDDDSFDVVLGITVLCFVSDPQTAVAEMSRVLAPGGRLVIGELGRWNTWAAWRRFRGWLGSTTWRHANFYSARQLTNHLLGAGLQPEQTRGAIYYPPIPLLARAAAPIEDRLSAVTTLGAAFIAASALQPSR